MRRERRVKKVGVISDTHGLLRLEAITALQGSDFIIHAGDIGKPEIIESLSEIAPVTVVHGNIDKGELKDLYPENEVLKVEEAYIYVLHIKEELDLDPVAAEFQVVVTGHTHRPKIEEKSGVLFLNPGSAGPKRFTLPITVATLSVEGAAVTAEIIELNV